MNRRIQSIITLLTISLICGCGGGTIGTGIGARGAEFAGFAGSKHTSLVFTLAATVKNAKGTAQPKATLRVASSVGTYSCVTTANGSCELEMRVAAGEPVSLSILKNGVEYRSGEYLSPAGESRISRIFILRGDGAIETQEP
jgi:hypothetical protein